MRVSALAYGVCLSVLVACTANPPPFDEMQWRRDVENQKQEMLYAPHMRDGRFFNPWMPIERGGFGRFLSWKFTAEERIYTEEEKSFMPISVSNLAGRIRSMPEGDLIAWVGHSTFLIRINGEYWLTDPMFSGRALVIKRKTSPAVTAEELKSFGAKVNVLVSHNHYDHFDKASIRALPYNTRVFVPLGLKSQVEDGTGKKSVTEMDWWESADAGNGVTVTCLPAQHWSRRISQGINKSLWASFLIRTPKVSIYYGGDSGYFVGYREIGRRFSGIDYAILPVTAYHPRWFMHYSHVDAKEALDAFEDLDARYFIPAQWGTFPLGDEPVGFGVLDLKKQIIEKNIDPDKVIIMDIGGIVTVQGK
ncbi:MAG TPA: hypothetical protein DDY17_06935 [Syntrophaceae bacterium]|jgi:N-acyl-phosphatidylethanolamine-hydrolysing phospholipase D|nr:hypothetical protein [Syntrophaceae bacterium]